MGVETDFFLMGDLSADGRAELAFGREVSEDVVSWECGRNVLFNNLPVWIVPYAWKDDVGARGSRFRLGHPDDDGKADMLAGTRDHPSWEFRWFRRLTSGCTADGLGDGLQVTETPRGGAVP